MGVPTGAQWAENLTAVAWVAAEGWVRSQLWFGFDPWPRNFHMRQVWPPSPQKNHTASWSVGYEGQEGSWEGSNDKAHICLDSAEFTGAHSGLSSARVEHLTSEAQGADASAVPESFPSQGFSDAYSLGPCHSVGVLPALLQWAGPHRSPTCTSQQRGPLWGRKLLYVSKTTLWNSGVSRLEGPFRTVASKPLILQLLHLVPRERSDLSSVDGLGCSRHSSWVLHGFLHWT